MTDNNDRSWQMLLDRLDSIERNQETIWQGQTTIQQCITSLKVDVAQLKIKAGIWGLIGGAIPVCTAILVWLLRSL